MKPSGMTDCDWADFWCGKAGEWRDRCSVYSGWTLFLIVTNAVTVAALVSILLCR